MQLCSTTRCTSGHWVPFTFSSTTTMYSASGTYPILPWADLSFWSNRKLTQKRSNFPLRSRHSRYLTLLKIIIITILLCFGLLIYISKVGFQHLCETLVFREANDSEISLCRELLGSFHLVSEVLSKLNTYFYNKKMLKDSSTHAAINSQQLLNEVKWTDFQTVRSLFQSLQKALAPSVTA